MVTTITLWKVPEGIRDELVTQAERTGRTLQQYVLSHLEELAAHPATDDPYPRDPVRDAGGDPVRDGGGDLGHDFARDMSSRARARSRGRRLTAIDVLFEGAPEPRRDSH